MIDKRAVPLFGLAFIVSTALGLGVIVARSPYTHDNIRTWPTISYKSTPLDTMSDANLEAIVAELGKLPPSTYAVSHTAHVSEIVVGPASAGIRLPAGSSAATTSFQAPPAAVGKELFTQKCTSCHTIGAGRRVGPDLKGVTSQKPKEWLVAFVTAPDEMIARGDPLATQLVKTFGVPMPNLGLSPVQVEAILAYLEAESAAIAPAPVQAGTHGQDAAAAGKAVFDQKCTSCHTVGGGKLVGPDLKGATARRDRNWLLEFIAAPDKVIASGDPIAAELIQEYRIPMPNLGVSREVAEQILAYLEAQGQ